MTNGRFAAAVRKCWLRFFRISLLAARFEDTLRETAVRRVKRHEAGLKRMIDIALAGEERVARNEILGQFFMPAATVLIQEVPGDTVPDLAIPDFVEIAGA